MTINSRMFRDNHRTEPVARPRFHPAVSQYVSHRQSAFPAFEDSNGTVLAVIPRSFCQYDTSRVVTQASQSDSAIVGLPRTALPRDSRDSRIPRKKRSTLVDLNSRNTISSSINYLSSGKVLTACSVGKTIQFALTLLVRSL